MLTSPISLFLAVLQAEKSNIKAPSDLLSGEGPLAGFQMASFAESSHSGRAKADLWGALL